MASLWSGAEAAWTMASEVRSWQGGDEQDARVSMRDGVCVLTALPPLGSLGRKGHPAS